MADRGQKDLKLRSRNLMPREFIGCWLLIHLPNLSYSAQFVPCVATRSSEKASCVVMCTMF